MDSEGLKWTRDTLVHSCNKGSSLRGESGWQAWHARALKSITSRSMRMEDHHVQRETHKENYSALRTKSKQRCTLAMSIALSIGLRCQNIYRPTSEKMGRMQTTWSSLSTRCSVLVFERGRFQIISQSTRQRFGIIVQAFLRRNLGFRAFGKGVLTDVNASKSDMK